MGLWIGLAIAAVAALSTAVVWWRRRQLRQLTWGDDYQRAKGQAYLQAQHTRNDIGDPFH